MVATNDRIQRITAARRDRITRASRVRLLAKQVAAGEYRVDADKLAEALIQRAQFHRGVQLDLLAQRSPAL
jgi:anti-sigma28 factor (negative regulator of flagellin synthesis)